MSYSKNAIQYCIDNETHCIDNDINAANLMANLDIWHVMPWVTTIKNSPYDGFRDLISANRIFNIEMKLSSCRKPSEGLMEIDELTRGLELYLGNTIKWNKLPVGYGIQMFTTTPLNHYISTAYEVPTKKGHYRLTMQDGVQNIPVDCISKVYNKSPNAYSCNSSGFPKHLNYDLITQLAQATHDINEVIPNNLVDYAIENDPGLSGLFEKYCIPLTVSAAIVLKEKYHQNDVGKKPYLGIISNSIINCKEKVDLESSYHELRSLDMIYDDEAVKKIEIDLAQIPRGDESKRYTRSLLGMSTNQQQLFRSVITFFSKDLLNSDHCKSIFREEECHLRNNMDWWCKYYAKSMNGFTGFLEIITKTKQEMIHIL